MSVLPIVAHLRGFDDRIAVQCARPNPASTSAESVRESARQVTYAQLAALVEDYATELGPAPRLVALAARNDLAALVAYLGALSAGCAVLLASDITEELRLAYDPYLPAHLAAEHPECIGIPIPGGEFTLEPLDDAGDGSDTPCELVCRGPNVMMGYAQSAHELALGRTVEALRTGDLALRTPEGLYQVVETRSPT
ncbi:AMP-binding protein [Nocardia sp. NBC_01730]|uniref:hypothetical protein n=1 Tax=Nocardia sp. NBC_01730 TaxID=2975998 RepID=UPI002E0DC7E0|nr:AMP-binding protein [Nocardia sp. NBC_01730]